MKSLWDKIMGFCIGCLFWWISLFCLMCLISPVIAAVKYLGWIDHPILKGSIQVLTWVCLIAILIGIVGTFIVIIKNIGKWLRKKNNH